MFVECRHILPRGTKCKAAALRGRPYCYFHDQLHTYAQDGLRDDKGAFCLPSIEDASGVQLALMQVMNGMANGRLDSRDGVRLIYGLQVALQALDRVPDVAPQEIVQSTACDGVGVDMANEESCLREPYADCADCTSRFGCSNVARQNKKSLRDLHDESRDTRERAEREPRALLASDTTSASLPVPAPDAPSSPARPVPKSDEQKKAEYERFKKFLPTKPQDDFQESSTGWKEV